MNISDPSEKKTLNIENILKFVSQEDIYRKYLPSNFNFNVPFSSPFRNDKKPSFIIGDIRRQFKYKDFASGDKGNSFTFVMKLYNVGFNEALIQIVNDLNIKHEFIIPNHNYILTEKKAEYANPGRTVNIGETDLGIKSRPFEQYDYDYWNLHGISVKGLRWGRIVAVSHYFINGIPYIAEKYAYAYIEKKDGITTYKIYQPYSLYKKWINNNNYSVWELWHLLPAKGKKLIITSSRKDALSIIENLAIPSVSFQAESILPKEVVMQDILDRFEEVYLLYDNDYDGETNWGQELAKKLLNLYPKLKNIVIPKELLSKDYSDLNKNHGRVFAKNELTKLI